MTRTYDHNGHSNIPIAMSDLTDMQMAGTVRMLMRDDLNHEGIVCAARDRILCLAKEKSELEERVKMLENAKAESDAAYASEIQTAVSAIPSRFIRNDGWEFAVIRWASAWCNHDNMLMVNGGSAYECQKCGYEISAIESVAALSSQRDELVTICEKLIDYRRRAGPMNFQLEKCDDFIHMMKVAIDKLEVK